MPNSSPTKFCTTTKRWSFGKKAKLCALILRNPAMGYAKATRLGFTSDELGDMMHRYRRFGANGLKATTNRNGRARKHNYKKSILNSSVERGILSPF